MKDHIIARATERFCLDKEHPTGILIEGFPTGLGKTHETCYAMLDSVRRDSKIKFIFICNQTKNLPVDKLKAIGKKDFGMSDRELDGLVLPVKSNIDTFSENYKPEMKKHIQKLFVECGSDLEYFRKVIIKKNLYEKTKGHNVTPEYESQVRTEYEDAERDFRNEVHKLLAPLKRPSIRRDKIGTDSDYKWIGELFPAVNFDDYRIIMMSDAKFMYTIDPIVAAPITIWAETDLRITKEDDEEAQTMEQSRLKDHIIVIDEFDTFKGVIQEVLISEASDEVDAVRAFRNLFLRLPQWKNLPTEMITESKWWAHTKKISIMDRFQKLIESTRKIRQKHHMEYLFKMYGVDANGELADPTGASFMFKDYEPYNIGNAFTVRTEPETRYNLILTGKNITSTSSWFNMLFSSLNELFIQMAKLVRDLAFNYMYALKEIPKKTKRDRDKDKDLERGSFTNCVDSVIDALDMEPDLAKYIKNRVIHNRLKTGNEKRLALDEPTFFSRGFGYISMRDSIDKQLQTHLYYTGYDATPESVLRHMAERTKVVALSATAEIESPICNFHLQYLRDGGVYFHEFNEEEKRDLNELIHSLRIGFLKGKSTLHCECMEPVISYGRDTWEGMFDEDDADDIYSKIGITEEGKTYAESRYFRAAQAIDAFLRHEDIRSMIGFFSAHVKTSPDATYNAGKMEYIIEKLAKKYGICIGVGWSGLKEKELNPRAGEPVAHILQINGSNYTEMKEELLARLSGKAPWCNGKGQKIFLITAYQTLGAGQNLQYEVPPDQENSRVWVRGPMHSYDMSSTEKDFDAIYLDDPTSIGPQVDYKKKNALDEYLFYAEYLDATNQISLDDKHSEIKNAFRQCYTPNMDRQPSHFKETDAYVLAKAQVIDQAVGRMARTGWKMPDVYLFLDYSLVKGGTFSLPKEYYGSYLSYEFETIYDAVHAMSNKKERDNEEELIIDDCLRASHNFTGYLDDLRFSVYGGDEEAIAKWQELRDFVLHHPTCPKHMEGLSKLASTVHRYGYIMPPEKASEYWFTLKYDFDQNGTDGLEISFDGPGANLSREDREKIWYCANTVTANLHLMDTVDYIHDFLAEEGIPVSFEPDEKLMSPPLFRNIFMGGLGELVGKHMIEYLTDNTVILAEMPARLYEKFDFDIGGGSYVDFKNWNENDYYGDEKKTERLLKEIGAKLEACEGKRVYVINIVVDGSKKYEPYQIYKLSNEREVIVVPYLYVVKNGKVSPNGAFIEKMMECENHE